MSHWLRFRKLLVSGSGLALTVVILLSVVILKFNQGGWITLACTLTLIAIVRCIKKEYVNTMRALRRLDELVPVVEASLDSAGRSVGEARDGAAAAPERVRTAVLFVNGYNGVGIHSVLAIMRLFGDTFRKFVFVQIGEIDHASFKGVAELHALKDHSRGSVDRYVDLMRKRGIDADGVAITGLDVADEAAKLAPMLSQNHPRCVFFGGQLVFKKETLVTRLLHNFTIFEIQRRLYQQGIQFVILPIRV